MTYLYTLFAVGLFGLALALNGSIAYLFDPFALIIVVSVPLALLRISTTKAERQRLWTYMRNPSPERGNARTRDILSDSITHTYATGGLLTLMGYILILNIFDLKELSTQHHMGDALIATFYAGLISEFVLRPLRNGISA